MPTIKANGKPGSKAEWIDCGHNRWRMSVTGMVDLQERTETSGKGRKAVATGTYFVLVDPCNPSPDRAIPLTDDLWMRLEPGSECMPGVGWLFAPATDYGRLRIWVNCHQCGRELRYRAGEAPIMGGRRDHDTLLPDEYATLSMRDKRVADDAPEEFDRYRHYHLCRGCIPANFVYCGNCRTVHKAHHLSPQLAPYADLVDASIEGRVPNGVIKYTCDRGRYPFIDENGLISWSYDLHPGDELPALFRMIGRATVCKPADPMAQKGLHRALRRVAEIAQWYREQEQENDRQDRSEGDGRPEEADAG